MFSRREVVAETYWSGVETNTVAVTVELALKSCGLGLYHRIVGGSGMATIDQHFALPPFCESLGQHGHTQIISQNTPRIFSYSFTLVAYIYFFHVFGQLYSPICSVSLFLTDANGGSHKQSWHWFWNLIPAPTTTQWKGESPLPKHARWTIRILNHWWECSLCWAETLLTGYCI